jgi:hypothetical protein
VRRSGRPRKAKKPDDEYLEDAAAEAVVAATSAKRTKHRVRDASQDDSDFHSRKRYEQPPSRSSAKSPTTGARKLAKSSRDPTFVQAEGKLCWAKESAANAHPAVRNLRLLMPFQVYACDEHSAKVELAVCDAVSSLKIQVSEGTGKDTVCAICAGTSGARELIVCSEPTCSYAFCRFCVTALADPMTHAPCTLYGFDDIARFTGRWTCWVCSAQHTSTKPRDRAAILSAIVNTSELEESDEEPQRHATKQSRRSKRDSDYELEEDEEYTRRQRKKRSGPAVGSGESAKNIPLQALTKACIERMQLYAQSGWRDDRIF